MSNHEYRIRRPQKRKFSILPLLLTLTIITIIAYPFIEARIVTIDEKTIVYENLELNLKNLRIVFASDFHQGTFFSKNKVDNIIGKINGMSADIVILGGDYANDYKESIDFFNNLPKISARLGVFVIPGEDDYSPDDPNSIELSKSIKNYGAIPLFNSVESVKRGNSYVYIAGVEDGTYSIADIKGVAKQVKKEDFVIFAGHSPECLSDMIASTDINNQNHWFDLALFGHTHGGQFHIGNWMPLSNLSDDIDPRYLSGWNEENRAHILTSNGLGTKGMPVRLFAPPQIHLITLKNRN